MKISTVCLGLTVKLNIIREIMNPVTVDGEIDFLKIGRGL